MNHKRSETSKTAKSYQELRPEFLQHSSIHGLKLMLYQSTVRYGRTIWLLFMATILIVSHVIIINLCISFLRQPTEIHLSTKMISIADTPFPAVGICSPNKISKTKLLRYAQQVFFHQQNYKPELLANDVEEMAKHLRILAGLYIHPFDDYDVQDSRLEKLHNILLFMYNNTQYNSREILRFLAPDCEDIVIRAFIFGRAINVSDYIFKRMTTSSVCCMFNYKRYSPSTYPDLNADKLRIESNSIWNGVQFVLQTDPDDFVYKQYFNDAFQVYIVPPNDVATIQSNTVGEIFVDPGTIMELPIQPYAFDSDDAVRNFSPKTRKCYFPEEGEAIINSTYYSLDECLSICRMQSMLNYCGCIGPSLSYNVMETDTVCSLQSLPCLTQWKMVWYRRNYFDYVFDGAEQTESHQSSFESCNHCLPNCDGFDFKIFMNELPLHKARSEVYNHGLLKGLKSNQSLAIVKIFFESSIAQVTVGDILADWVLLLNRFGGIMSLMYGFGILSYIEILYYLSGKWGLHLYGIWKERRDLKNMPIVSRFEVTRNTSLNQLYWEELKPQNFAAYYIPDKAIKLPPYSKS